MPIAADLYYYFYEGGHPESDAVVFLHGAGGNHLSWPPEIRRLPGLSIYALDLPGHGKSTGPGEQSIDSYVTRIQDWMIAVGLQRAAFAGHSMGSAIALAMALKHPPRVRALALIGSGVRLRVHPDLLAQSANPATLASAVETVISWSFSPSTNPRILELVSERMLETRATVLHGDFTACDQFDIMGEVENIRCPALVVCGEEDRMTPTRNSLYLAGKIQDAKLVVIPDAGHMVMLEKPQQVAAELSAFFGGGS